MSTITASGLIIEDLIVGTGAVAAPGEFVTVHYTGWLADGTKFHSTRDRRQPLVFPLGVGRVIPGWEGVRGMKVGGRRKLIIPSTLAYGTRGVLGVIPPNATIVCEIELLDVCRPAAAANNRDMESLSQSRARLR